MTRVLVVEDEEGIADFVRRGLILTGFEVDVVYDGESALDRARDQMPDLVILDLMLPGLDGVEVCRRLRAASDVPIVVLTARDSVSDKVEGLESKVANIYHKVTGYAEAAGAIKITTGQQTTAMEVMGVVVNEMKTLSEEVARGAVELKESSQNLMAIAQGLFKVVEEKGEG